jgi:hypothetical protein
VLDKIIVTSFLDKIIVTSFNYSAYLCSCSKHNYNTYFVVYITFGCMLKRQRTSSCEEYYLLKSRPIFQRNILHPSSGSNKPSKIPARKQVASREHSILLATCFHAYSSLKMGTICSSETLVDFEWTTWGYIPEDSTLHNHHCEHLKSYIHDYIFFSCLTMCIPVSLYLLS